MRPWWRRLLRVLDQNRIRLPKRSVEPRHIRPGDRLQIGLEVWRVGDLGSPTQGDSPKAFELRAEEASAPTAILFAPDDSARFLSSRWFLVKGRDRLEVPGELIVHFPCGFAASYSEGRTQS